MWQRNHLRGLNKMLKVLKHLMLIKTVLGVTGSTAASPLAVLMCSKSKCEHEGASGDEAQQV